MFSTFYNPSLPTLQYYVRKMKISILKIICDIWKKYGEHRTYESVDDKEPISGYVSQIDGKQNSVSKWLMLHSLLSGIFISFHESIYIFIIRSFDANELFSDRSSYT